MNWFKGWFGYVGYLSETTIITITHKSISVPYAHDTSKFHASDPQEKTGFKRERHMYSAQISVLL